MYKLFKPNYILYIKPLYKSILISKYKIVIKVLFYLKVIF